MTIKRILEEKGRDVTTLGSDVTLAQVAEILSEKRIGAIVLLENDGSIAGIVSERDIVRVVGRSGPDSLKQSVKDAMTPKVVTCSEDLTVDQALMLMTERRFRHLPVTDENGSLCGFISIGDVVKRKISDAEAEASQMRDYIHTT
ncbi:CBS domain-containing protein [Fulvimarina sp. 2208YS6-2-32]|uniref:CBS domain-containing protein n=1 Tax=Fulvimarina uroteuthidis TaxID=3098149 RepID=A0ABU5I708_9HYPH|nr:CBS domain-containing protein [Fulvimarina sp. 2208YS6-2-32]MDY8110981.1 CBS domain-containing protein [Fulvimarina sp. 2208YS6-2-32]